MKVKIEPKTLDTGFIQLNISAVDIPEDLFGVSFHLNVSGAEFRLEDYALGNVFSEGDPLVLIRERKDLHKIVAGISLKRGDSYSVGDGGLVRFYISPAGEGRMKFGFENGVVSIFNGAREDVKDVEWKGSEIDVEVDYFEMEGEENAADEYIEGKVLGTNTLASISDIGMPYEDAKIGDVYVFLLVSFLILLFGFLAYMWFSKGERT